MNDQVEVSKKLLQDLAQAVLNAPRVTKRLGWGVTDSVCAYCFLGIGHTADCVVRKAHNIMKDE